MAEKRFDFPSYIASECIKRFGDNLPKICIVLPGRRASLFLQKELASQLGKGIEAPEIIPVHEFFERISGHKTTDRIPLIFELYQVYKALKGDAAESLESFMTWAETALHDFNEVDNYLIEADKIFGNLRDIREIEEWSLNSPDLSLEQEKYLEFWNDLGPLYQAFSKHLRSKNWFTSGSLRRYLWQDNTTWKNELPWDHVVIAGLNVLSLSEEKILFSLHDAGKASIYWDADQFFVDDPLHEAGHFLRSYKEKLGKLNGLTNSFLSENRSYSVIACSSQIAQARALQSLLKPEDYNDRTAIVLADESLLIPVLHSLPIQAEHVNVTLGFPLKSSPLYGLIDSIFKLHIRAGKNPRGKRRFYFKDILSIIQSPALPENLGSGKEGLPLSRILRDYKLIYPTFANIVSHSGTERLNEIAFLFEPVENASDMLDVLKKLIIYLKDYYLESKDKLGNEFAFHLAGTLSKIQSYLQKYPWVESTEILHLLLRQLMSKEQIPFFGEPLSGLQIMGMLETRSVSFDKVILLGANEDKLPKARFENSLIPFDLRKAFGLPTHRQRDAMYAYYFYRLVSRTASIQILYNAEPSVFAMGEKSRFITQLEYYLNQSPESQPINQAIIQSPIPSGAEFKVQIPASEAMRQKLHQLCKSGISPTAINAWRTCPLDFFYKYIADFREEQDVEENIEISTFGIVVHYALEVLYTPFVGTDLNPDLITALKPKIENAVLEAFNKHYSSEELQYGANRLSKHVAIGFTRRFIEHDLIRIREHIKAGTPIHLLSLEKTLKTELDLRSSGFEGNIVIKGKADRIERIGQKLVIIDYKTGHVIRKKVGIKDLSETSFEKADSYFIQLMSYLVMSQSAEEFRGLAPQAAILSLRTLSEGLMEWNVDGNSEWSENALQAFCEYLARWMNEINNPELLLSHNPNAKYCNFCH